MKTEYDEYVTNVSAPDWAISFKLAEELVRICDKLKPARILDLGSGFSSYVLGKWAKENGAEVWSIDDKEEWLEKTREFVAARDAIAPNHHFGLWEQFFGGVLEGEHGKFDLVVHDMGVQHTRMRTLRPAMLVVAPGGTIVLDDMNFTAYGTAARWLFDRWEFKVKDLRAETLDEYGRYAAQARAPKKLPKHPYKVRPLVGVPYERNFMSESFRPFWEIARTGRFHLCQTEYTRTDVQRNLFALRLLYNPIFTHILMLDMDHEHQVEVAQRLARWVMQDPGKLVIGTLYHRRGEPYEPCAWHEDEEGKLYSQPDWEPTLHKVSRMGTGGLLIAREAFEIMPPPWFKYTYEQAEQFLFPSEDMYFCGKCEQYGINVWLDGSTDSDHFKVERVNHAYFERWVAEHADQITDDGTMIIKMGVDEDEDTSDTGVQQSL